MDEGQYRIRLCETVHANGRLLCLLGLMAAGVTLVVLWSVVSPVVLLGWLGAIVVLQGVAFVRVLAQRSRNGDEASARRALGLIATLVTLVGCAWGALAVDVAFLGQFQHAVFVVFVAGALAATHATLTVGHQPVVLGFTLPAMLPPAAMLLARGGEGQLLAGLLCIAFAAFVVAGAQPLRHRLRELVSLQVASLDAQRHLDARRDQVEKLGVALRTTQDKLDHAEQQLRRSSADLGLALGKSRALSDTLERVSMHCAQSGLANRRSFEEALRVEWRRAMREKKPVSLVVLQIEDFELYGATYGAQALDNLLKRLGKGLRTYGRRGGDLAARLTDARFALLLPGCDSRNAFRIADTFRERVEALRIDHEKSRVLPVVTVYAGVSTIIPARHSEERMLLERAEAAVYEAGFQGGNRVVLYRALDKLRLEHWNLKSDGPLSEAALQQKLLIWGFEPRRVVHPPGTALADRSHDVETILAAALGQLRVTLEGQSMVLRSGDCLFIPPGITYSAEVPGADPVLGFEATPAA